jgi:hypothetical protein
MALSYRRRLDRRFGFVLIAIFTLGVLGGALATALNGGDVPDAQTATAHVTRTDGPL